MSEKILVQNRKARFNYEIIDTIEAGIILLPCEVKSIKSGNANIADAHAIISGNEAFILNMHVSPYKFANQFTYYDPTRKRKLLLHSHEIRKLIGKVQEKGMTLVPLSLVVNKKRLIKIEIGIARGKKLYDKRETIKQRDLDREQAKTMKELKYR